MLIQLLSRLDLAMYRMRFAVVVLCATIAFVLSTAKPANASCGYLDQCFFGQCQDTCAHTTDYWGYFDPSCTMTNCCVQGICYFTNQPYCYYCNSLQQSYCGYERGCP